LNKGWRKRVAPVLIILAAALASVAVARPLGPPSGDDEKTAAMDVIVALDISDSMGVADVKSNRLTSAKDFVKKLVLAAPNNRYGLVLFSGDAVITCPATLDHDAFLTFVDDADFQRANLPGTRRLAPITARRVSGTGFPRGAMVTDGEHGAEPVKAEAAKQATQVYGPVPARQGGRIPGSTTATYGTRRTSRQYVVSKQRGRPAQDNRGGRGRYFAASDGLSVKALAKSLSNPKRL
jgi:Ca-activated chloride channel family protein